MLDFEFKVKNWIEHDSHMSYIDLDDIDNQDFKLKQVWRIKNNHCEYLEFDESKMSEE